MGLEVQDRVPTQFQILLNYFVLAYVLTITLIGRAQVQLKSNLSGFLCIFI